MSAAHAIMMCGRVAPPVQMVADHASGLKDTAFADCGSRTRLGRLRVSVLTRPFPCRRRGALRGGLRAAAPVSLARRVVARTPRSGLQRAGAPGRRTPSVGSESDRCSTVGDGAGLRCQRQYRLCVLCWSPPRLPCRPRHRWESGSGSGGSRRSWLVRRRGDGSEMAQVRRDSGGTGGNRLARGQLDETASPAGSGREAGDPHAGPA